MPIMESFKDKYNIYQYSVYYDLMLECENILFLELINLIENRFLIRLDQIKAASQHFITIFFPIIVTSTGNKTV